MRRKKGPYLCEERGSFSEGSFNSMIFMLSNTWESLLAVISDVLRGIGALRLNCGVFFKEIYAYPREYRPPAEGKTDAGCERT
jgi:hypothetical protein